MKKNRKAASGGILDFSVQENLGNNGSETFGVKLHNATGFHLYPPSFHFSKKFISQKCS